MPATTVFGTRKEEKMKIALVNPPASRIIYGEEYKLKSVIPCLGLFYLQAYCQGLADIEVFEGELYVDMEQLISEINAYKPDVLGVTTNTSTYPLCRRLAREVNANTKAVGGPYASFRINECLEDFDIVFIGDAEVSLRTLTSGVPVNKIPGIAYRDEDGNVLYTLAAPLLDLDTVPFPDRRRMQLGKYQASPHRQLPEPFATMMTTRGCGFLCSFCLSANRGMNDGNYRERSVDNVVQELRILTEQFGVRSIQFWDDTFTMRKERTRELCPAIGQMNINYVCNTRTDKMDAETASLLAESGCRGVFFGVESGNEDILYHNMHKGVRNEQVRNAVADCRRAGIWTTASFIFGAIDDTEETIRETLDFALELDADYALFNIYTAHPGTYGYYEAVREGIIDEYRVDLDQWCGEPVGVPTVCRHLSRTELHLLKAQAYVEYYVRKDSAKYYDMIQTYRTEIERLQNVQKGSVTSKPAW